MDAGAIYVAEHEQLFAKLTFADDADGVSHVE